MARPRIPFPHLIWFALWTSTLRSPRLLAADWPTYRADARRSGYTSEALPKGLSLRWTYHSRHAPQPAWSGRDTRMPFDRAHQPVMADGTVFFGSSADCKVYALDAATGEGRWSFFTDGPVRFAPAVWQERVFAVSDDGFLYCLAATDGKLLWKVRGGPIDSMVLGNGRMSSRWPARGGPAIADGVVYWAAGIWPSEGIYVYAVEAASGEVLWCNDMAGGLNMAQPHPTAFARSGVSAQGELLVAGDKLLVPTGRAVPAAFRRQDGEFLYFHLQQFRGTGGSSVVATDTDFLTRGSLFDLATGAQARRLAAAPETTAVTPHRLIFATAQAVLAIDRANLWTRKETVDRKGQPTTETVLRDPAWQTPLPHAASALIVAGHSVVVGGSDTVTVLDMTNSKAGFTAQVEGEALGLAAAGGRLIVSTDKGYLYCFSGATKDPARVIEPEPAAVAPADAATVKAAEELIRRTGFSEGYCLDLGCGNGALTCELAKRTKLTVYALDSDPSSVARARQRHGLLSPTTVLSANVLGEGLLTPPLPGPTGLLESRGFAAL